MRLEKATLPGGIGHVPLSQLFVNLAAPRIERVETVLSHGSTGLIGFFRGAGFAQGKRLGFCKPLQAPME